MVQGERKEHPGSRRDVLPPGRASLRHAVLKTLPKFRNATMVAITPIDVLAK
jgi:hypothetical protein